MKKPGNPALRRFELKLLGYGNSYYIERVAKLEKALARRPCQLQIDLIGGGEIPADMALLIRSILAQRSAKIRLITNARSSLSGGSVLVWLLGDQRLIRDDARIFFRRAQQDDASDAGDEDAWKETEPKYTDSFTEADPEEADYARVLELINEYLPVKELAGRAIPVAQLRQFGLVENGEFDRFLEAAFAPATQEVTADADSPNLKHRNQGARDKQPRPARE